MAAADNAPAKNKVTGWEQPAPHAEKRCDYPVRAHLGKADRLQCRARAPERPVRSCRVPIRGMPRMAEFPEIVASAIPADHAAFFSRSCFHCPSAARPFIMARWAKARCAAATFSGLPA